MLETPEAPPTWFSGTAAVAADEAGPLDMPMPTAIATSGSRNAAYFHEASTNPTTTRRAVVSATPTPMVGRPPYFEASFGTGGAPPPSPPVAGSVASPASSGLKSRAAGSWKYKLSRY